MIQFTQTTTKPTQTGTKTGGIVVNTSTCPASYPPGANLNQCGHTAFVEIDAAMSYKYAMAYVTTGDRRYAEQAIGILRAWMKTNRKFGVPGANGPLEASWWGVGW